MKILGLNITNPFQREEGAGVPNWVGENSSPTQRYVVIKEQAFTGERSLGELGPAVNYIPSYASLSVRSWQAYLDSLLARAIIGKWIDWIIGEGLKLKTNPSILTLNSEGVKISKERREEFNNVVEDRFDIWSRSKKSSFSGEKTLYELSHDIFLNASIGGDVLVVLRYIDGMVKVQVIDGSLIVTPYNKTFDKSISNGVKIGKNGGVEGYYVKTENGFEFVKSYSKIGLRQAFLVKGTKWRLNHHRGLPVIASALESIKKIDRYQDATLSSAEEIANIAYQIVHQAYSSGENPDSKDFIKGFAKSAGLDDNKLPTDDLGRELANKIAVTTKRAAINNPVGAEIKTLNKGQTVTGFEEFYKTNSHVICAAVGIPPNVAMSVYNDSFSASRAATKDWDHTMDVARNNFTEQCLSYIYKFWLYIEVATNKIDAPGYIDSILNDNPMIYGAYERSKFTGPHFPHIDPDKEVKAMRRMLGTNGEHLPLINQEDAMEQLGTGDADSTTEQFADEIKLAERVGLLREMKSESLKSSGGTEN